MKRRELKQYLLSLLASGSWPEITSELVKFREKEVLNHLFTALCHTDEAVKWHAVSSFGLIVPAIAAHNLEEARVVMRRFLWNLNDESGGIGWGVAEAMAEVMANQHTLFREYVHMLISYMREDGPEVFEDGNFLELPALQRGVVWGVGRLLSCRREEMEARGVGDDLCRYLGSGDPMVLGLAAWGLGMCVGVPCPTEIQRLLEVDFAFSHYREHRLEQATVAGLAGEALQRSGC